MLSAEKDSPCSPPVRTLWLNRSMWNMWLHVLLLVLFILQMKFLIYLVHACIGWITCVYFQRYPLTSSDYSLLHVIANALIFIQMVDLIEGQCYETSNTMFSSYDINCSRIITVSTCANIFYLSELYARGTVYQQNISEACCSLRPSLTVPILLSFYR